MRIVRAISGISATALLAALVTVGGESARAADPFDVLDPIAAGLLPDVREIDPLARFPLAPNTAAVIEAWGTTPAGAAQLAGPAAAGATPEVGTTRMWLSLDEVKATTYLKEYTLRGVGGKIEVWVASGAGPDGVMGTDLLPDDCRRAVPGSTTVTDAQVDALIAEYDGNIFPKESKAFSVAPDRDGSTRSTDSRVANLDFSGDGDKVVTLVDNVRDPNFYDFPANQTYIAGFFSRSFNELTDRNIQTIDAYDWAHRTGLNPPDEPDEDICVSRPGRPQLYEGIFAHEYQHLLQYYTDPGEVTFVNEGLSDYALTVTGYGQPGRSVFQRKFESHITCYQGFGTVTTKFNPNARPCGGPQNSLTLWGDEGQGAEILADYGVAWAFLLFVRDRYGPEVLTDVHRDGKLQGLAGIEAALQKNAKGVAIADVLHDFQIMLLLDKVAGGKDGSVSGIAKRRVSTPSLSFGLNLLNPATHIAPGAAPNGADFVPLRGTGVELLDGTELDSVAFAGRRSLTPLPLQWTVAPTVPLLPAISFPQQPGAPPTPGIPPPALPPGLLDDPALFSGNAARTDAGAVFEAVVPSDDPTLTYTTSYAMETNFDYGYTVLSTDGGRTYQTLANGSTVPTVGTAPGGDALTGSSGIPTTRTFDLAPFAGQEVLIGFRYVSDAAINAGGWYVDDVTVGGRLISDGASTEPFSSFSEVEPIQVKNWTVTLVGLDEENERAHVVRRDGEFAFTLTQRQLASFASYPVLVAIVSYDDPTETVTTYAPYTLTVNDITQLGGR